MILTTTLLFFAAVSTMAGLAVCSYAGQLTQLGAGLALLSGAVPAIAVYFYLRRHPTADLPKPRFVSVVLFIAFALFALRHYLWLYYDHFGDMYTLNRPNLKFLGADLASIANILQGAHFWPHNPRLFSQMAAEPFGMSFFTAFFAKLGVPLQLTLSWTGVIGVALIAVSLYAWGRGFGLAAFLFSGGIAGYMAFLTGHFYDYQNDFFWKNIPLHVMLPQRGFLYALPAGLVLLWSWRNRYFRGERPLPGWMEGILWGAVVFFDVQTYWFLFALFLIWTTGQKRVRESLGTYLISLAIAVPLTVRMSGYFREWDALLGWAPGWMFRGQYVPLSLFTEFGFISLLVAVTGIGLWRARDREGFFIYAPAVSLFLIAQLFVFGRQGADNISLIVWCYILLMPVVWQYGLCLLRVWLRGLVLCLLFLSGFVSVVYSLGPSQGTALIGREELDGVCGALEGIPVDEPILTAPGAIHPVALCGHPLVLGYPGELKTFGRRYRYAARSVERIMRGEFDWKSRAKALGARYLFWGPREIKTYQESNLPWVAEAGKLASGHWGVLYDLAAPSEILKILPPGKAEPGKGLRVKYYDNTKWHGPSVRGETRGCVYFDWDEGEGPIGDPFGAIYEGEIYIPQRGEVRMFLASDDGSDLAIDGKVILENLGAHPLRVRSVKFQAEKGWHAVRIRYYDLGGEATLMLWWELPSGKVENIPPEFLRPAR